MSVSPARSVEDAQRQATWATANLCEKRTGLPCIVSIPREGCSRKDAARHDARAEVAPGPRMRPDQVSSCALRPFGLAEGRGMPAADERRLARWVEADLSCSSTPGDGRIERREDALDLLEPV